MHLLGYQSNMLAVLLLVVTMVTASASEHDERFEAFRSRYKRDYHVTEVEYRRSVYADNVNYINAHNARAADGEHTFTLRENQFTDMTNEEFRTVRAANQNGEDRAKKLVKREVDVGGKRDVRSLPYTVDWRTKGYVSPVRNQGQCNSGWAFSAVGALEGQHFRKTGDLVELSEQNLLDCSKKYGNHGCEGGLMDNAFRYIKANRGLDTAASYPYKVEVGFCKFNPATVGSTCDGYVDIQSGSESSLQNAVASVGPISAAIDSSHFSFQFYHSGVYYEPACSSTRLDHGVLIVGYGTYSGQDYWLVKNSWGITWGLEGYIRMSRKKNNQCGIATKASYPLV